MQRFPLYCATYEDASTSLFGAPFAAVSDWRSTISVSGVVESVSADRLELDYREGNLMVEVDDGERVSVLGDVDSDLLEGREIVAESVVTREE